MTCPVSHLLGSECRDDPLLQERAQAPVDVSALTSNAPVPFRMPWSHRRCAGHLIRERLLRCKESQDSVVQARLGALPPTRIRAAGFAFTKPETPSTLSWMSWKKERTVMVLFDAANAYEFRIFPVERFCALSLSRRGILILENWQERLPA